MNPRVMLRVFLIAFLVTLAQSIVCLKDSCNNVTCQPTCCQRNQILVKNGGFCGCCDLCVTQLGEGEMCPIRLEGGTPPTSSCAAGLICSHGMCKRLYRKRWVHNHGRQIPEKYLAQ
uniref:U11-Hexatoxin-Hc1a_1 n=1 Tax=Hadronyche cerberea TaxID=1107879 RepID=A0A4Q8K5Q2_HADCE